MSSHVHSRTSCSPREPLRFLGVAVSEELEYFRVEGVDAAAGARHVHALED